MPELTKEEHQKRWERFVWKEGDIQIIPTEEARKLLKKDPKKKNIDEKDAE